MCSTIAQNPESESYRLETLVAMPKVLAGGAARLFGVPGGDTSSCSGEIRDGNIEATSTPIQNMRFLPAEPDIATIFNRLRDGDIDLQPEFQRGEVWPLSKQQRLIDTILRQWIIPPILLIESKDGAQQQVLDGQQRLAAIRDFKLNKFRINGCMEPYDASLQQLDGLLYSELPTNWSRLFDKTPLRMYEITGFKPDEPAEIFFRLNQPTVLTPAEKRNAFYGPVRDQVRELVGFFENRTSFKKFVGFNNTRMAYDDLLARFACTLEQQTLQKKVTAQSVNEMYRRSDPIKHDVFHRIFEAVDNLDYVLGFALSSMPSERRPRLNKATLSSWLLFFARLEFERKLGPLRLLSNFIFAFEANRHGSWNEAELSQVPKVVGSGINEYSIPLLWLYTDRATARVADVSSVLLRDFAIWYHWFNVSDFKFSKQKINRADLVRFRNWSRGAATDNFEEQVLNFLTKIEWGRDA